MATRKAGRKPPVRHKLSVDVNPEIRKALKLAATVEGLSMLEKVHVIFCRAMKRPDLMDQVPSTAASPKK